MSKDRCVGTLHPLLGFVPRYEPQTVSFSSPLLPQSFVSCSPLRYPCTQLAICMRKTGSTPGYMSRRSLLTAAVSFPMVALASNGERRPWWPPESMRKSFARCMAEGMVDYERAVSDRKRELFAKLGNSDRILDVGIGTGPNLPYLRDVNVVVGLDPNEYMAPYAKKAAEQLNARGLRLEMEHGNAEDIPFPDSSFDAVICTLVLCSVRDPGLAIREIQRVLKPGGKFVFIEHVHAKSQPLRLAQTLLDPLQVLVCDGCHLSRDTESVIREEGTQFDAIEVDNFFYGVGGLISSQISGIAVKKQAVT